MLIEVREKDYNGKLIEEIERIPKQMAGWQQITYKGKKYKLWGGIRNNFRIII